MDAPFGSALAEEQIGLVAKLEASSSAPTSGHLERRGMAIARKFSKDVYVLGLVQSPCLVHIFTLGQCKMHFVANMGCELPTHAAGWELAASTYLLDKAVPNGVTLCSFFVCLEGLMQVFPIYGRSQTVLLSTHFWLSLSGSSSDMFWYTPNSGQSWSLQDSQCACNVDKFSPEECKKIVLSPPRSKECIDF